MPFKFVNLLEDGEAFGRLAVAVLLEVGLKQIAHLVAHFNGFHRSGLTPKIGSKSVQ